jgi:hypothetical protein
MITCLISGGNTGADQGGLQAGRYLGLATGGYAPKNYRTENGNQRELLESFGVMEHDSLDYAPRTKDNIRLSDGTVIFGRRSPGSNLTEETCRIQKKPCLWMLAWVCTPKNRLLFLSWVKAHNITVLNVAGNRESVSPGIQDGVSKFLIYALKEL